MASDEKNKTKKKNKKKANKMAEEGNQQHRKVIIEASWHSIVVLFKKKT